MTITYGFYDSISSDRLYNAKQMGSIFDGLILDGIYQGMGDKLRVVPDSGMDVSVGSGRAWFDHTWTYNDAAIPITVPTADALLPRIDVIYLEVNENVGVRANSVDILEGTPASYPNVPELTNTSTIHQYALAHIYVGDGVTVINSGDITNMAGTENTPWVALLVEYEELQAQIWAIVGDTNPPLIELIQLKAHFHDGITTERILQVHRRQGGSAVAWGIAGENNYTPGPALIQVGTIQATTPVIKTVTFPVTFTGTPVVVVSPRMANRIAYVTNLNAGSFGCGLTDATGTTSVSGDVSWHAIGAQ
jgi:hypothetical protein